MTWISQGIRGILEKKCNQDTKKRIKMRSLGHLKVHEGNLKKKNQ